MIPFLTIPTNVNISTVNQTHSPVVKNISSPKHRITLIPKILWVCLTCVQPIFAQLGHGTTVVLLVRDSIAYMGADSRVFWRDSTTSDTACKIAACGNKIIGISGIGFLHGANVITTTLVLQTMKSFPNDTIVQSLARPIQTFRDVLLSYRKLSGAPDSVNSFGFIGCEFVNGTINVTLLSYSLTADTESPLLLRRKSHKSGPHFGLYYDGLTDSIYTMSRRDTLLGKTGDPIALIEKLIAVQSARYPLNVGGPVDIVELSRNGVLWIKRKHQCKSCNEE